MQPGRSSGCPLSFSSLAFTAFLSFFLSIPSLLRPSVLSSDHSGDTAYPAVISLITFTQLSVASAARPAPLAVLPLIACSFLCPRLEGNVFHYLKTRHKYSRGVFFFFFFLPAATLKGST